MIDLKNTSTTELELMRDNLEIKLVDIRGQLDTAKSNATAKSVFSDIDWFNKAKYALKKCGLQHQHILRELADRRKKEKKDREKSIERNFIDIAKRRLDPDVFREYMDEANEGVGA